MPKKAKYKAKSKAKLNIKKSKKGRRAAPPKRRKVAVSIPALEAAATKAADFAAKHEAAASQKAPRSNVALTQMQHGRRWRSSATAGYWFGWLLLCVAPHTGQVRSASQLGFIQAAVLGPVGI